MSNTNANSLSKGDIVLFEGSPFKIVNNDFHKPGKGKPVNRIKLKNLTNNINREITVSPDHAFKFALVESFECNYLYSQDNLLYFMNKDTFETEMVELSVLEENTKWLVSDIDCILTKFKDQVISVSLPTFVDIEIKETGPSVKGDSEGSRVMKKATLSTGAQINVPVFILTGDSIKIDTRTGLYKSRSL